MKNIKLTIIGLIAGTAFFNSCDSRTQQDLEGIVSDPTYTKNIKPIMDAKCINCHSPNSYTPAYPNLDTYQNVVDAQNGNNSFKLLCSIQEDYCTSERMPKNGAPLSNTTIINIKNWINKDFPE